MNASFVASSLAVLLLAARGFTASQSSRVIELPQLERGATAGDVEFLVMGNVSGISSIHHARSIVVYVRPESFKLEPISVIFRELSRSYPADDQLVIRAVSDEDQLEQELSSLLELESYFLGNAAPRTRCGSAGEPPLSAQFYRINSQEDAHYWPAMGAAIRVEFGPETTCDVMSGDEGLDLFRACICRDADRVGLLLQRGVDPNAKTRTGSSILVEAAFSGPDQYEILELFLDSGADINQTSSTGWTALMAAVYRRAPRATELLLGRGADVDHRSEDGRTALIVAAQQRSIALSKRLLEYGARTDIVDRYGNSALMTARAAGNKELIRLLMQAGASQ